MQLAPVRYLAQPTATSVLSTRRGTHTTVQDAHSPCGEAGTPPGLPGSTGPLLTVPPPPYSRRPGALTPQGSVRKHVKFPDTSKNPRVVLDEDSSFGESPGERSAFFTRSKHSAGSKLRNVGPCVKVIVRIVVFRSGPPPCPESIFHPSHSMFNKREKHINKFGVTLVAFFEDVLLKHIFQLAEFFVCVCGGGGVYVRSFM